MLSNFTYLLFISLLFASCKKEVDPKAYIRDASVQLIQEQITAQNDRIIAANKRVEDSFNEVKKAHDNLENLSSKRARYFTNLNLLEIDNQKLLWLEYRLITLKKEAQKRYLLAELSGSNIENPNQWVDFEYRDLLADSLQKKTKKK